MTMKDFCSIVWLIGFFLPNAGPAAALEPPKAGQAFPEFSLKIPEDALHREYLGLSGSGQFKVSQINSNLVIIEIFSMYCPYCQREAPEVNRLYQMIAGDPKLKERVKMIGIGIGNSAFEADFFKKKYEVPFPLFPDETFAVHKRIGEVRTPYFFVLKLEKGKAPTVILSELGGLRGAERFLKAILDLSGLRKVD
jgi:thiol-disulfide isomerase/thioredoxin